MARGKPADDTFNRPVLLHLCKDGTISYRTRGEPVFNGVALPVFSVDTPEQAQDFQVRFGRRQYTEHPQIPGKPWFRLSHRPWVEGEMVLPPDGLDYEDVEHVTTMFQAHWRAHHAKVKE